MLPSCELSLSSNSSFCLCQNAQLTSEVEYSGCGDQIRLCIFSCRDNVVSLGTTTGD